MTCPHCGHPDCVILSDTQVKTKGYSLGEGCCGYLLLGPVGFLCGLCGMGETETSSRHFWVCPRCGRKFQL